MWFSGHSQSQAPQDEHTSIERPHKYSNTHTCMYVVSLWGTYIYHTLWEQIAGPHMVNITVLMGRWVFG